MLFKFPCSFFVFSYTILPIVRQQLSFVGLQLAIVRQQFGFVAQQIASVVLPSNLHSNRRAMLVLILPEQQQSGRKFVQQEKMIYENREMEYEAPPYMMRLSEIQL
jgi:hypothetical protein